MSLMSHTIHNKKKCINRSKHFRSLTYKNKGISTKTAAHIYETICRPLLEYCHPIYITSNKTVRKILSTAETTSLRGITKMRHPRNSLYNPPNSLLYQVTKIIPIEEQIKNLWKKFAVKQSNTDILKTYIIERDPNRRPNRKTPPNTIWEELQKLSGTL